MALMTGEQYIESIRKIPMEIYMFGKKVENPVDNPILRPSLNSVRMTYDLAQMPEYQELMTAISPETGERINRFTHIHRSTEDLRNKVKMQRLLGQKTAACFQRCVGMDAFNAEYSTTYEIDKKYGTSYHENFKKFMLYCQENDLTVDGGWVQRKNPDFIVKWVDASVLGENALGTEAAQSVCKNLLTRKGVHELASARDKRILLLSASLLDTPQLQTAAAVCLAQAMYPDLFADVDAAQAVRQLADESGVSSGGVWVYAP